MTKYAVFALGLLLFASACSNSGRPAADEEQETSQQQDAPKQNESQSTTTSTTTTNFDKTLSLQGVNVQVATEGNTLVFRPSGLEDNSPWEHQIDGKVTGAEIEDMNGDGAPEVLAYVVSGPNQKVNVIGYTCYGKKSMGQIYFPGVENVSQEAAEGYNGYDEVTIVETTLVQRFPVYQNGQRTGKTRQIQYKLADGENGRVFRFDRMVEY